jgi:hypothetical protein
LLVVVLVDCILMETGLTPSMVAVAGQPDQSAEHLPSQVKETTVVRAQLLAQETLVVAVAVVLMRLVQTAQVLLVETVALVKVHL